MGKLLSLLSRDDSNCCAAKSYDVFLDFENAAPTETERAVYDEVERVLRESEVVLEEIQIYRMKTPAIQNDFSYYRRIVSRQRVDSTENMLVSTELANRMSLFYAHATPMLKVLSEATSKFVNDNADDVQNTTETLGTMAKVCLRMLENPKLLQQIEREDTKMLVLRVMVGLVILYDHVHPEGAFVRGAHVDVKGCVRLLQAQPAIKAEPLLNALRYTTKHLNGENTPKNIQRLLAA
ncbi:protein FAM49B isoform X2 [Drosophila erecta]|uniref:protein FAM49B isoform X2 n=1 Tax=Drosophila erecta TaxID=7220 RepID=UPI000F05A593|nr:protein FAM49B isoform X2 [Drosophila erecta]